MTYVVTVKQMFIKCSFQKRRKKILEVLEHFIKTILVRYEINSIEKHLSLYDYDIHVMIFDISMAVYVLILM